MNKLSLLLLLILIFNRSVSTSQTVSKPHLLKTDHLENPIGIDNSNPRLMWMMDDTRPGACQTAFRVIVGIDSLEVLNGEGEIWDTGRTDSGIRDRKSTRLNSSHVRISYAVF